MGPERKRSIVAIDVEDDVAQSAGDSDVSSTIKAKNTKPVPIAKRRLIPLLPKAKPPSPQPPERPALRRPGPCGIRACEKLSCNLESHRRYAKDHGLHALRSRNTSSTEGSSEQLGAPSRSRTATPQIQKTVAKSAGFPALPIKSDGSKPTMQRLFQTFFTSQLDEVLKLIVAPFDGYDSWAQKRHQELFDNGTQKELDCLNFVGAAYIHIFEHTQIPKEQSIEIGIMVHSSILNGLRTMLGSFEPDRDVDIVLSIMYTLVLFGLLQPDKSMTALLSHKRAMIRVIESCGGLHKCGPNMALAISLDRLISIVTETPPEFSVWNLIRLPFQRPAKFAEAYGAFFASSKGKGFIDQDVLDYCTEVCRGIEILEGEKWTFDASSREASGEIYFLYYLRDRTSNQFVHLNVRMAGETSTSRCILFATRLVEYVVLWNNYNTLMTFILADRLLNLLDEQDLSAVWKGHEDVLKWVLFGLTCLSKDWIGREKALDLCKRAFDVLYRGSWPKDWQDEQKTLVCRFVWSLSWLDKAFASASADLEKKR